MSLAAFMHTVHPVLGFRVIVASILETTIFILPILKNILLLL